MCQERRTSILERILENVAIEDHGYSVNGETNSCWVWQGSISGDGRGGGYGRMSLNSSTVAVHRVVYTHFYGYIPPKKQIDHLCNNRLCCNPDHLEMVSHKTNQKRRDHRLKESIE